VELRGSRHFIGLNVIVLGALLPEILTGKDALL
jgi:hypothetical protein